MNRKPVIGVTSLYDDEKDSIWMLPGYVDGIAAAGGIPVLLPLSLDQADFDQIKGSFHGFLLTGGHDVSPSAYGQKKKEYCGAVCTERDRIEKLIFQYAYQRDVPTLGICRGIQLINVLLGGTLYQDIKTERPSNVEHHMEGPYDRTIHSVSVLPGTPLYELWKIEKKDINSIHHQAICEVGRGLRVMAIASDGIVEGVYCPQKTFIWGVQWHPEYSYQADTDQLKIFKKFVSAAADFRQGHCREQQ
jgi:putative glutamine amidotransferase